MNCRDCSCCTEPLLKSLLCLPFRLVLRLATFWNVGTLIRRCPQCGHRLSLHQKVRGRYMD